MTDFDCPNCKGNFVDKDFYWKKEIIKCLYCKKRIYNRL